MWEVLVFVVVAIRTIRLVLSIFSENTPPRSHTSDIENNVKEDRCNNTGHPALQVRFSESFTYVVIATRVRVGATRYYVFFGILEFWSSVQSVVE
jgi:hypothetical protein